MIRPQEGITFQKTNKTLDINITRVDYTKVIFDVDFRNILSDILEKDCLLVIDSKVWSYHKAKFAHYKNVLIDAGDSNKTQATIDTIIDAGLKNGVSRAGYFVGVGGGTVTDMVGLAANQYFRGIKYINIPTSLLGMVDAAVGGKTAINHEHQKNMIGSFYHPSYIIYDFSFLDTLDRRNFVNGFGEIIKVALLSDKGIFLDLLELKGLTNIVNQQLKEIVALTAEEKLRMLGANCFERDLRRPLNLGHSIAHPIEDITHFRIMHGEAVALGCLFACYISFMRGGLPFELLEDISNVVRRFGLRDYADKIEVNKEELWVRLQRLIMQRGGKGLLYVLPTGIGDCEIIDNISRNEFDAAFKYLMSSKNQQVVAA